MIKSYIVEKEGQLQLGQWFRVKEFACKDGSPIIFIDDRLTTILNKLRSEIQKPIIVTSGYRTPTWNEKVKGAKYSYHTRGMAADIKAKGMSAKELANKLNALVPDECGIIVYKSWVHFDVRTAKYRKGV